MADRNLAHVSVSSYDSNLSEPPVYETYMTVLPGNGHDAIQTISYGDVTEESESFGHHSNLASTWIDGTNVFVSENIDVNLSISPDTTGNIYQVMLKDEQKLQGDCGNFGNVFYGSDVDTFTTDEPIYDKCKYENSACKDNIDIASHVYLVAMETDAEENNPKHYLTFESEDYTKEDSINYKNESVVNTISSNIMCDIYEAPHTDLHGMNNTYEEVRAPELSIHKECSDVMNISDKSFDGKLCNMTKTKMILCLGVFLLLITVCVGLGVSVFIPWGQQSSNQNITARWVAPTPHVVPDFSVLNNSVFTVEKKYPIVNIGDMPLNQRFVGNQIWMNSKHTLFKFTKDYYLVDHVNLVYIESAYSSAVVPTTSTDLVVCDNFYGIFLISGDGYLKSSLYERDCSDLTIVANYTQVFATVTNSNQVIFLELRGNSWQLVEAIILDEFKESTYTQRIFIHGEIIYISSVVRSQLFLYDKKGNLKLLAGKKRGKNLSHKMKGVLASPYLSGVDSNGTALLADSSNNRLQICTKMGNWGIINLPQEISGPIHALSSIDGNNLWVIGHAALFKLKKDNSKEDAKIVLPLDHNI